MGRHHVTRLRNPVLQGRREKLPAYASGFIALCIPIGWKALCGKGAFFHLMRSSTVSGDTVNEILAKMLKSAPKQMV